MKTFYLIMLTGISFSVSAQYLITKDSIQNVYLINKLDSMGINEEILLNRYEVEYFNAKFQERHSDFDFANKKIAFYRSPGGDVLSTKQNYFLDEKDRQISNLSSNMSYLILFNEQEKLESGGYDAVVVFWSKIFRSSGFYVKNLREINSSQEKESKKKKTP